MKNFPREVRDLDHVPRWSIIRQVRGQSVASHSYFVAVYAEMVANILCYEGDRHRLLLYALQHDWSESFTGDWPGPAKHASVDRERLKRYEDKHTELRFGETIDPTNEEKTIVKCADMIDECLYIAGEKQLGNKSLDAVFHTSNSRLKKAIDDLPYDDLLKAKLWSEVATALAMEAGGSSNMDFSS